VGVEKSKVGLLPDASHHLMQAPLPLQNIPHQLGHLQNLLVELIGVVGELGRGAEGALVDGEAGEDGWQDVGDYIREMVPDDELGEGEGGVRDWNGLSGF